MVPSRLVLISLLTLGCARVDAGVVYWLSADAVDSGLGNSDLSETVLAHPESPVEVTIWAKTVNLANNVRQVSLRVSTPLEDIAIAELVDVEMYNGLLYEDQSQDPVERRYLHQFLVDSRDATENPWAPCGECSVINYGDNLLGDFGAVSIDFPFAEPDDATRLGDGFGSTPPPTHSEAASLYDDNSGAWRIGVVRVLPLQSDQIELTLDEGAATANAALAPDFSSHSLSLSIQILPDYNGDQAIDAADYTVWRDSQCALGVCTALQLEADGNQDGAVDGLDYDRWREYYGAVGGIVGAPPGALRAVPEPGAAMALMLVFWAADVRCRPHCRRRP